MTNREHFANGVVFLKSDAEASSGSYAVVCGDITQGLAGALTQHRYDAIIATYSLHHLTVAGKVTFIQSLLPLLREDGTIYIGDVAFAARAELEACRAQSGDCWDKDELYFVYDELKKAFPAMKFDRLSPCSGILSLRK